VSATTVAFVGALVYRHPFLLPILQQHLDDLSGEVLPHLLIADVERWLELEIANRRMQSIEQVEAVLQFIEEGYTLGDGDVEELISVSFLEHFPRPGDLGSELRDLAGPQLQKQLGIIG
jgi:hypothetical protein